METFNKNEVCTKLIKFKEDLIKFKNRKVNDEDSIIDYTKKLVCLTQDILYYLATVKTEYKTSSAFDIVELEISTSRLHIISTSRFKDKDYINCTYRHINHLTGVINDYITARGEIVPRNNFVFKELNMDVLIDLDNYTLTISDPDIIKGVTKFVEILYTYTINVKKSTRLYKINDFQYFARFNSFTEDYDFKYLYIIKFLLEYIVFQTLIYEDDEAHFKILKDVIMIVNEEKKLNNIELVATLEKLERELYLQDLNSNKTCLSRALF